MTVKTVGETLTENGGVKTGIQIKINVVVVGLLLLLFDVFLLLLLLLLFFFLLLLFNGHMYVLDVSWC